MSWRDREYHSEDFDDSYAGLSAPRSMGVRRPPPFTLALMVVHGLAFVLALAMRFDQGDASAGEFAWFDPRANPAGILLHPFLTTSPFSAAFVALALWSLAGRIEQRLGPRPLLALYITGNLVAGSVFFALAQVQPAVAVYPLQYPAGALAAMCGAAWQHFQQEPVQVFGKATTLARMYAICAAIVAGLALLSGQQGAIAWLIAVALGGGSAWGLQWWRHNTSRRPRRTSAHANFPVPGPPKPAPADREIDDILDKISRNGVESLSDEDRQRLETARQKKLKRDR